MRPAARGSPPVGRAAPVIVAPPHQILVRPILFDGATHRDFRVDLKGKGSSVTTRSIFDKVCPSCMATLALDAKQCACGHDFAQGQSDTGLTSEEIRLKAEELYENYLAARADQAAQAAKTAQALFARDPSDIDKSNRVADTIRESQEAQAALQAQSARIAEMRKALRHAAPAPMPAVTPVPAPMAETPKKRTATKPVRALPVRATRKTITAVATVSVTTAKRAANTAIQPAAKSPAPVAPAIPAAKAPVQSAMPNKAFRKAQAAKAEKILRAVQNTKPPAPAKAEKPPEAPLVEVKTAPPPIATVPVKTAPRLYAAPDKKDCPNCTASVAQNAARCRCGYEFSSSEQHIPALTMSEEERAAFAKLFS
ncbi:MAG TPA: zinc ribbon domain-containing protein [Candidatus Methylomirabilis sp.]|nr:zinc ribbon domain-containing protein [Candidatus Methylomirabilis sp.]